MAPNMIIVTHLLLLTLTSRGLAQGFRVHDLGNDYYYDDNQEPPHFTARRQEFTVEAGQSIIIPCEANNVGDNRLVVKHRAMDGLERLMFAGTEKVTRDRRVSMEGQRLHIAHARPRDAGTFICMFDLVPPVQLLHSVDVQHAPTVRALGRPEQHVARGQSLTLTCQAQGNPMPVISWARQEGPNPPVPIHKGDSVTLDHIDRHSEGTYLCTADNGIGEPAAAAVTVIVEYPPEIITEKHIVRTGEGDQVELACVVHGRPVPEVTWTRDGNRISTDLMDTKLYLGHQEDTNQHHHHHRRQQPHGGHTSHRHTLTFKHVGEKDFGAYMCIAHNSHGQTDATIQMTGLPSTPLVTSSPNGGESDVYTLTWQTESYYPITMFMIKYRKAQIGMWQTNHTMVMGESWKNIEETVKPSHYALTHALSHDLQTMPEEPRLRDTIHTMTYTLSDLEVATDYAAQIRVRNKYGWSEMSDTFIFSTKKAMAVQQPSKSDVTLGMIGSGVAPAVTVLLPLLLLLPPLL